MNRISDGRRSPNIASLELLLAERNLYAVRPVRTVRLHNGGNNCYFLINTGGIFKIKCVNFFILVQL